MEEQPAGLSPTRAISYRWRTIDRMTLLAKKAHSITATNYCMLLVLSGAGSIQFEYGRFALHSGACLLLPPGETILIKDADEVISYYEIKFDVIGSEQRDHFTTGNPVFDKMLQTGVVNCEAFSTHVLLADELYKNYIATDEIVQLENQIRFQRLLLSIMNQFHLSGNEVKVREAIAQSIRYISKHYNMTLTVDELATMSSTNRWQYTKLFKEMTSQSPNDYINSVRIDKAKQLLLMTDDNHQQVAQSVGYSTEYYFNRKFKQKVGLTPGQYRSYNEESSKVFAPFLEDFLLALNVEPVMQGTHHLWGRQDYLGMTEVPQYDVTSENWSVLQQHKPDFIILDEGYYRWGLEKCSQFSQIFKLPSTAENWKATLTAIGTILGRHDKVTHVIEEHEQYVLEAKQKLSKSIGNEKVAVLRIAANTIYLYGGAYSGYTGPLIYNQLGLTQPEMVQQLLPDQRRIHVSLEALNQLDADHLIITFDREDGFGDEREILNSTLWNNLPAVKGRRVYEVDFFAWMNYGVLSHNRKITDMLQFLG